MFQSLASQSMYIIFLTLTSLYVISFNACLICMILGSLASFSIYFLKELCHLTAFFVQINENFMC